MSLIASSERALILACAVNGILGAATGVLAAGVDGAKVGLIAGLVLAVLPVTARNVSAWLGRPDGLARFLAAHAAATAVAAAQTITGLLGSMIGPIARSMQVPALVVRFAADVIAHAVAIALGGFRRIVATPLGLANIAALGVVVANIANLEFAAPVTCLGLGMLLLVLLVSESERRDEEAREKQRE